MGVYGVGSGGGDRMNWRDSIDPATIPEAVLRSEIARRNAGRRKTFGGGRPRKAAADGLTWNHAADAAAVVVEPARRKRKKNS